MNATAVVAVTDMGFIAESTHRSQFDGTILATDEAFGTPEYDPATNTLSRFVAGPHLTVDGAVNIGFYDALLPDALPGGLGVTEPEL